MTLTITPPGSSSPRVSTGLMLPGVRFGIASAGPPKSPPPGPMREYGDLTPNVKKLLMRIVSETTRLVNFSERKRLQAPISSDKPLSVFQYTDAEMAHVRAIDGRMAKTRQALEKLGFDSPFKMAEGIALIGAEQRKRFFLTKEALADRLALGERDASIAPKALRKQSQRQYRRDLVQNGRDSRQGFAINLLMHPEFSPLTGPLSNGLGLPAPTKDQRHVLIGLANAQNLVKQGLNRALYKAFPNSSVTLLRREPERRAEHSAYMADVQNPATVIGSAALRYDAALGSLSSVGLQTVWDIQKSVKATNDQAFKAFYDERDRVLTAAKTSKTPRTVLNKLRRNFQERQLRLEGQAFRLEEVVMQLMNNAGGLP